ncbi:MAG: MFS transporter [Filifactoraceae bacterium]
MERMFHNYRDLRHEIYILVFGRIVTNMGALIWPMLTLILKNKLGMTASQAADFIILMGVAQLPCTLIGGKLADRFSKKNIIICCDLVTVCGLVTCFFLPISFFRWVSFA